MYISEALDTMVASIETATGWTLGPQVGDSSRNPGPNVGTTFGIDLQSSNANWYRDKGIIRMKHLLLVDFTLRVEMRKQYLTMKKALDAEQKIIDALQSQRVLGQVRAKWAGSGRSWISAGERRRTIARFSIEHDLDTHS